MAYSEPAAFDEDRLSWASQPAVVAADATWTANSQAVVDGIATALVARGYADTVAALGGATDATFSANEQTLINNILSTCRASGVISNTVEGAFVSPYGGADGRWCAGSGIANVGGTYGATEQAKLNNLRTACIHHGLLATD